jgi:hypothetical protein
VLVLPSRVKILTFIPSNLLLQFRSREEPQNAKKHKWKTCSSKLSVNKIGNLDTAQLLPRDFRFVNANFRWCLINSVNSTIWSQNTWLFTVAKAPGSRSARLYFNRRGTYRPWRRTQRSTLTYREPVPNCLMENTVDSHVQIFAGAQTIIAVREGLLHLFIFLCKIRLYFANKLDLLLSKCRIRRFIFRFNIQNHWYCICIFT